MSALSLYIKENHLTVGEKLPPERELATTLGTSRPTLRKILDRFEKIGVIERNRKGGTTIVENLDPVLGKKSARSNIVSFITAGLDLERIESKQTLIQESLLKKGYILNTYYASPDRQDLEKEQQYLRSLFRINPKGLIVTASPHGSTNEFLFNELEKSNIRVAHMHYYKTTLPREAFILPDWRCAGVMAISFLMSHGCENVVFAHPSGNPPGTRITREGIETGAEIMRVNLLNEASVGKGGDAESGKTATFLKGLPPKTGIITLPYQAGVGIAGEMAKLNGKPSTEQPIIAIDEEIMSQREVPILPVLNFPWEKRIKSAVDYITSPDSTPQKRELTLPELQSTNKKL